MKKLFVRCISVVMTMVLVLGIFANIPVLAAEENSSTKYSVSEIIVKYKANANTDTLKAKIKHYIHTICMVIEFQNKKPIIQILQTVLLLHTHIMRPID